MPNSGSYIELRYCWYHTGTSDLATLERFRSVRQGRAEALPGGQPPLAPPARLLTMRSSMADVSWQGRLL